MKNKIHINCDMGESFGRYTLVDDEALMPFISAANIACGFHAGDPVVIERTITSALKFDLEIGAHPSFPDLQGFGRRVMDIAPKELESIVRYQIAAVRGLVEAQGGQLIHVKPHGALYNYAAKNKDTAEAIVKAIVSIDDQLKLYAPPNSHLASTGQSLLEVVKEAFIDRRYVEDGSLMSRKLEGSVIRDPEDALSQVKSILENSEVITASNVKVPLSATTFCIHGDNPAALRILSHLQDEL